MRQFWPLLDHILQTIEIWRTMHWEPYQQLFISFIFALPLLHGAWINYFSHIQTVWNISFFKKKTGWFFPGYSSFSYKINHKFFKFGRIIHWKTKVFFLRFDYAKNWVKNFKIKIWSFLYLTCLSQEQLNSLKCFLFKKKTEIL